MRSLFVAIAVVALGIVVWPTIWKKWAVYSVVRNVDRKGADYVRPAADALAEHDKNSVPVFVELLQHEDMYVRIVAAEKLGDLGPDAKSVDALVAALHDDEWRVRMTAVSFLSTMGKAAELALPEIVACLADNESQVQAFAVQTLGRLAKKGVNTVVAVPALTELSKEPVFSRIARTALEQMEKARSMS
jgi:HEAT repeat protein